MKAVRILVPLVVLVAIALWVSYVARSDRHDAPRVASPAKPSPPAATRTERESTSTRAESDATAPAATIDPEESSAPDTPPSPSGMVMARIYGTIVVTDPAGEEHPHEDGSFHVTAAGGGGMSTGKVDVIDGHWKTTVCAGPELRVSDAVLGGRPAHLLESSLPFPKDGFVALHAKWRAPVILHVRSRETGRDIESCMAVRTDGREDHPGAIDELEIAAQGRSPLSITEHGSGVCVGATGYAWRRIEMDLFDGGERTIILERGGDLEVHLTGVVSSQGAFLCVVGGDAGKETVSAKVMLSDLAPVSLTGLHAGSYGVTAELGDRWGLLAWQADLHGDQPKDDGALDTSDGSRLLGTTVAEVRAGERTLIEIELRDLPAVPKVPLDGELFVPAEWDFEMFGLCFEPLDPAPDGDNSIAMLSDDSMTHEQHGTGTVYRWDMGTVYPGRFVIALVDPRYNVVVDVGTTGEHVRMELPPPGNVIISALAKNGGNAADLLDAIDWRYGGRREYPVFGRAPPPVERNPATGTFDFIAPLGEIEIFPVGDEFVPDLLKVNVQPGITCAVLEVQRSCGVSLELMDGDTSISLDPPWRVRLHTSSGDEVRPQSVLSRDASIILAPEPGRYRVTLTGPDDYEPVPEQIIDVPADTIVDHTIQLERRP